MPSTQSQQTSDSQITLESPANSGTIEDVTKLLAGVEPEAELKPEKVDAEPETVSEALAEAEKPIDSGESQEPVKPPKNLSELAEKLGIEVKDLYGIEIPASEDGGENHTIGTLKDRFADESDYAGRELRFEERRVKHENDQAKARADLETILQALPPDAIKPEVLDRARAEREVMLNREAARVLDVIPEWSNDESKRTDMNGIGVHLADYGFNKAYIDQIADHRMLRYMRDNMNRKALVDRALSDVKTVKNVPKSASTKPIQAKPKVTATPASPMNDKLAAIDALLPK